MSKWFSLLRNGGSVSSGIFTLAYQPQNNVVIRAKNQLATSGSVRIKSGADYTFKSGNTISLNAGFKVESGAIFKALHELEVDLEKSAHNQELSITNSMKYKNMQNNDLGENNQVHFCLKVYPNPVRNILNIEFDFDKEAELNVEFVNSLGQRLLLVASVKNGYYSFDVSNFPQGIYSLLFINNLEIIERRKFVKI